ncbi:acyl-CoA thioesterase II [Vibrio palustris]|uniref:Acyl-CoA thioesterase 2 n=1 Tax=Vibrio palustris TaxID=1918946 RepID=A0A1R4B3E2_9VIBR|nr:acyl-CoA thioesterase II [Vibrio palustris]SJL83425.1 Acyl-CoA thioesterase 2 [Vibrio palustris]
MSQALTELLDLLQLQPQPDGLYLGNSQNLGLPQVYGGQVIGQALSAARYTVEADRNVHSFHSYFLHPGDPEQPIYYDVETLRDGRSFSTRRVKAMQGNRPIFYLTASYQQAAEGFEHQNTMPAIPGPDEFVSERQIAAKVAHLLPEPLKSTFCGDRPIEVRPVNVVNPLQPEKTDPIQYLWIRANGELPDNQLLHQYLLGYASDWGFLVTALHPHGVSLMTPNLQVATIDHSIWYHRPVKMDEWLLFAIESPTASNGRGLVKGEIYSRDGRLVATAVQEGVIRYKN